MMTVNPQTNLDMEQLLLASGESSAPALDEHFTARLQERLGQPALPQQAHKLLLAYGSFGAVACAALMASADASWLMIGASFAATLALGAAVFKTLR